MGLFSRMKDGIKSRANSAIDKAIDPEKEIDMAILELEEGKKKALAELISYKATAKQMEQEIEKYTERVAGWEKKAMLAVRAGDDEAAKIALKEKRNAESEIVKITRDRDEAASYAIQLNRSRKEFETKLSLLKMRRGTLATQLAAARAPNGDAFGNDRDVWDKFERAEGRIDEEIIASEVDSAMRGEQLADQELEAKILAAGSSPDAAVAADDPLAALKAKMADEKAKKEESRRLAAEEAAAKALPKGDGS
jgi:phage shock protein A